MIVGVSASSANVFSSTPSFCATCFSRFLFLRQDRWSFCFLGQCLLFNSNFLRFMLHQILFTFPLRSLFFLHLNPRFRFFRHLNFISCCSFLSFGFWILIFIISSFIFGSVFDLLLRLRFLIFLVSFSLRDFKVAFSDSAHVMVHHFQETNSSVQSLSGSLLLKLVSDFRCPGAEVVGHQGVQHRLIALCFLHRAAFLLRSVIKLCKL